MLKYLLWLDVKLLWAGSFGRYNKGEYISALAWDKHLNKQWQGAVFVPIIDEVFRLWEVDHCRKAWLVQ